MQLMTFNSLLMFDIVFMFFLFLVGVTCLVYYLPTGKQHNNYISQQQQKQQQKQQHMLTTPLLSPLSQPSKKGISCRHHHYHSHKNKSIDRVLQNQLHDHHHHYRRQQQQQQQQYERIENQEQKQQEYHQCPYHHCCSRQPLIEYQEKDLRKIPETEKRAVTENQIEKGDIGVMISGYGEQCHQIVCQYEQHQCEQKPQVLQFPQPSSSVSPIKDLNLHHHFYYQYEKENCAHLCCENEDEEDVVVEGLITEDDEDNSFSSSSSSSSSSTFLTLSLPPAPNSSYYYRHKTRQYRNSSEDDCLDNYSDPDNDIEDDVIYNENTYQKGKERKLPLLGESNKSQCSFENLNNRTSTSYPYVEHFVIVNETERALQPPSSPHCCYVKAKFDDVRECVGPIADV